MGNEYDLGVFIDGLPKKKKNQGRDIFAYGCSLSVRVLPSRGVMGNDVLRALHEYLESAVHLTGSETYLRCQKVSERGNRLEVTGRKHVYWCTERNFRPFQSKCGNHGRNPRKACGKIFAVCVHSEQLNGEQMKMPKEMHSLYPGISWGELRQGIFRRTTWYADERNSWKHRTGLGGRHLIIVPFK